jgi:hypothetical protein
MDICPESIGAALITEIVWAAKAGLLSAPAATAEAIGSSSRGRTISTTFVATAANVALCRVARYFG